jgi:carbonic anhydrase
MRASDEMAARNSKFAELFDRATVSDDPLLHALVVTCMDFRVSPAHFAGIWLGDAFVLRVIGGRLTDEVMGQIVGADALSELHGSGLEEVIIVHHTGCGTAAFARDGDLAAGVAARMGTTAEVLRDIAVDDPFRTVAEDVAKLRAHPGLDVEVTGFVYDLDDGRLTPVS